MFLVYIWVFLISRWPHNTWPSYLWRRVKRNSKNDAWKYLLDQNVSLANLLLLSCRFSGNITEASIYQWLPKTTLAQTVSSSFSVVWGPNNQIISFPSNFTWCKDRELKIGSRRVLWQSTTSAFAQLFWKAQNRFSKSYAIMKTFRRNEVYIMVRKLFITIMMSFEVTFHCASRLSSSMETWRQPQSLMLNAHRYCKQVGTCDVSGVYQFTF